jgi:hypothetical protein
MRASVRRRLLGKGLLLAIGVAIGLEFILNCADILFQLGLYGISLTGSVSGGDIDGDNLVGHLAAGLLYGLFGIGGVLVSFHLGRDVFDGIVSSARTFKLSKGLARKVLVSGFSILTVASRDYAGRISSAVTALDDDTGSVGLREKALRLSDALAADDWRQAAFSDSTSGFPAAWQQNYRMIRALFAEHAVPGLIVLMPPSDIGADAQSPSDQAAAFMAFLSDVIILLQIAYDTSERPDIVCFEIDGHVPYQDYNLVVSALLSSIDIAAERGYEAEDVCIDVTSGLKTFSIAAASVTMRFGTVFSYMPTGRETPSDASLYEPGYYDIQIDRADML